MPRQKGIKIESDTFLHLSTNDQIAAIFNNLLCVDERIDHLEKKINKKLRISAFLTFIGAFMGGFCAYFSGGKLIPRFIK